MSIIDTSDFSWNTKMGLICSRMCQTIEGDDRPLSDGAKQGILDFFQNAILMAYAQLRGEFVLENGHHRHTWSWYLTIRDVLKENRFISDDTLLCDVIALFERIQNLLYSVVRGLTLASEDKEFLLRVMSCFSDYFTCKSDELSRRSDEM